MPENKTIKANLFEKSIFWSRWLQAPLYFGLIVAQCVYVYQFLVELWHLVTLAFFPEIGHGTAGALPSGSEAIMLSVLGLIDVVMIANSWVVRARAGVGE